MEGRSRLFLLKGLVGKVTSCFAGRNIDFGSLGNGLGGRLKSACAGRQAVFGSLAGRGSDIIKPRRICQTHKQHEQQANRNPKRHFNIFISL